VSVSIPARGAPGGYHGAVSPRVPYAEWIAAAPAIELDALSTPEAARRPELRLLVVGCGDAKRASAAAAADLYTGSLTRDAIRYARGTGRPWAIVSGQHGIVWPGCVIEPYNARVPRSGEALDGWRSMVVAQLARWFDWMGWHPRRREGDQHGTLPAALVLEVHAGADYVNALRGGWWSVEAPLEGLNMLRRRAWYAQQRAAASPQVSLFGEAA
jgi:hypothetical protein